MNEIDKVYESPFMRTYFFEEHRILESIFTSEEMNEDKFQSELLNFLEVCEEYSPMQIIWDLRNFSFSITPDLQSWLDQNINKKELEIGVKREAFLMPKNFISQLSVEQSMEEEYGKKIEVQYFSDRQEAINWLLLGSEES